jgi:glycosyltransferase involved in cell wall biosynthesis
MRVLTTLTYYYPNISGLSLHAQMISEALAKNGYAVTVLCMRHDKKLSSEEVMHRVMVKRAAPICKISKGFLSLDYIGKSFMMVKKSDVVILHLPQFEGIVPALFAKLFGKRVVIFYHCDVTLPKSNINRLIETVLSVSNSISLRYADRILHSTEDFARHSRQLKPYLGKVEYTYPPIKKYKVNNRIKNLLIKKTHIKNCYSIGIVSRIAADKGLEYVLNAIPILHVKVKKKFLIYIAGPAEPVGEEAYKKKITELIGRYKDDIVFLGKLKDEEMGSLFSILDVLVVPSINSTESFATVQVEAMMQGTPVVVSDLPGVRIPVKRTGMGLVVPKMDSEKFAEAIALVLKNKNDYCIEKGRIIKEFSFIKTLKTYENAIQNI